MSKKVVVISISLRAESNSAMLAEAFARGAEAAGHAVEIISLAGKEIAFCRGCLACQKSGACVIKDDALAIADKVEQADVVAYATPIYYYEMSGQLKTLLDRMNSLYSRPYRFRQVYFLSAAAEDEESVDSRAVAGLEGWVACFDKAELKATVFAGGVTMPGEAKGHAALERAFLLGKNS